MTDLGAYFSSHEYGYPYYALASSKAGADIAGVAEVLRRFSPQDQRLDYQLADAILSAQTGQIPHTIQAVTLTRYRRPWPAEGGLLTQFTYADICEALYQMTNSSAIHTSARLGQEA